MKRSMIALIFLAGAAVSTLAVPTASASQRHGGFAISVGGKADGVYHGVEIHRPFPHFARVRRHHHPRPWRHHPLLSLRCFRDSK